jgi:hypothetical protein
MEKGIKLLRVTYDKKSFCSNELNSVFQNVTEWEAVCYSDLAQLPSDSNDKDKSVMQEPV